jgi:hypothetical protein
MADLIQVMTAVVVPKALFPVFYLNRCIPDTNYTSGKVKDDPE